LVKHIRPDDDTLFHMSDDTTTTTAVSITLGQSCREFLDSLKPDHRVAYERYVRRYVQNAAGGESLPTYRLTGSLVESFAEAYIKASDPLAAEQVAALKAYFQFLKKREYTVQNFGILIRVRRIAGRPGASTAAQRAEEKPVDMTAEGMESLKVELTEITGRRTELVAAVALAREDKDFRENSPLEAAREALAFSDQRQKQLETALKRARVVEFTHDDRAAVGSTVTVTRLDTDAQHTYKLVGAREANAREQKISVESPVGKELLGRRPGDEIMVKAPNGEIAFKVNSVLNG